MAEAVQVKPNVSYVHMILSTFIVIYSWMWSFTILLPLFLVLKLSTTCRNRFFSWVFPVFSRKYGHRFHALRKKMFEHMPTKNIKVLEIGVGTGANFEFYDSNCKLTLLDMNKSFDVNIREALKKYPHLRVDRTVFAMAEDMEEIPDFTYDVVVCTHLLCSVRNITMVLREVSRVLKPEGKFLYMEHIGFPVSPIARFIQALMNPLWRVYSNGCHLNRQTHDIISDGFTHNSYQISYPLFVPLFFRPHVIGVASHSRLGFFKSVM